MAGKKKGPKWTKTTINAVRIPGLKSDNGWLNDHGWNHIKTENRVHVAMGQTLCLTLLSHQVGVHRKVIAATIQKGFALKNCPSARPKRTPPAESNEKKLERINRRKKILKLVETVEEREGVRLKRNSTTKTSYTRKIKVRPFSNPTQIQRGLREKWKIVTTISTISRDLHHLGYVAKVKRNQVYLTAADK